MARYSGKKQVSDESRDEAMRIARGTQQAGQTKEQTKLIAQGIAKGIDLYKKQQKAKARESSKLAKRQGDDTNLPESDDAEALDEPTPPAPRSSNATLPWILLGVTWLGIGALVINNLAHRF